ncbi:2-amino-4-hydroxy-6-hydroxymethyldihydropteridine diphosphokinase [Cellulosimicrobium protaetiae]|uniref:Bifunctional folate synthesis protein n=1 Tax=Cellulosimicrobium protaetiae TaxID=2587808 RepID=A0A6M5UEY3_9MICO|nr:2-amino-4-hydroxy-6-hydroxymethyldihydropteridine diphosphokinase [Cellulosimicrobium protaetiae]QJW35793.1 2-amino-4-hydroxy-6-hydroxymethyldihydropteridine diphosphokinase [Cellulosimicrobium protaetiae]
MTTAFAGAVLDADGRPFDRIRLTGLSATGHHGVYDHEKEQGQLFRADVVLHLDTRAAASGDDLAQTVSYAGVAEDVVAVLAGSPADLVETVAERIAATILTHDEVVAVDVAVHKPQAPITVPFEDVEVVIRRDRVVVPVVGPLARRSEQHGLRDVQAVGPIPVGSVAPALIHGVGETPVAEDRVELAPAPDVMPPSIPPGTTSVGATVPPPAEGDSHTHDVSGGTVLDDALDGAREAPGADEPTAPVRDVPLPAALEEEPTGTLPPAEEPRPAPYDALLESAAPPAPGAPAPEALPGAAGAQLPTPAPVPTPAEPTAPELPDAGRAVEPPAEQGPEPVLEPAPVDVPVPPVEQPAELPVDAPAPLAAPPQDVTAPAATSEGPDASGAADGSTPTPPAEHDRMDDVPAGFVEVVLALGANLGDAQQTLRDAITDLDRISGLEITEVSPLARTEAVGGPDQPDFLNTVLLARTRLSARDLLHACQAVENAHGRVRDERWGPRTLDVDLVVYGTLTAVADDLELPHPRAHERAFVLEPWSQIDPDAVLPGLGGGPVAALAATAPDRGGIRWLALDWLTDAAPEPAGAGPAVTDGADQAHPAPVAVPVPDPTPGPAPAPPPAPATAPDPEGLDDPYRQRGPEAFVPQAPPVPPETAPGSRAPEPVGLAQPGPQPPAAPSSAPHRALPQPFPQSPPQALPQPGAEHAEPGSQAPAPGTALPVAPPQTTVLPQQPGAPVVAPAAETYPARPVFAPVSQGLAPAADRAPAAAEGAPGSFDELVAPGSAPFPGATHRPTVQPAPEPSAPEDAQTTERGGGAFPVFAPVRVTEPAPVAPAAAADADGIIRSVPFAPAPGGAPTEASAPGPLADSALHPATDPWPPFGPVSGSGQDSAR